MTGAQRGVNALERHTEGSQGMTIVTLEVFGVTNVIDKCHTGGNLCITLCISVGGRGHVTNVIDTGHTHAPGDNMGTLAVGKWVELSTPPPLTGDNLWISG